MALVDAVRAAGIIPPPSAPREAKKRFSERLSAALAAEVADSLRAAGFPRVRPVRGGPGEKEFQGEAVGEPWVRLYSTSPRPELRELTEAHYLARLRDIHNVRNPHAQVGVEELKVEGEDGGEESEAS